MDVIETKKRKLSSDDHEVEKNNDDKVSVFKNFKLIRVLREDARHKLITLHGSINSTMSSVNDFIESTDFSEVSKDAVVQLERKAFNVSTLEKTLRLTKTVETLCNDIYSTHDVYSSAEMESDIKATVICPATEKHIAKYSDHEPFIIHESQNLYETLTLPSIMESNFSLQWVYNILEKKKESDRIIVEDPDPEVGFVMVPDMKWDRENTETLYTVALIHKHNIKSLRDLREEHIPLLENILNLGQAALQRKFNVKPGQLRVYFHYQPSYYHLHVHFTHIKFDAPGSDVLRAHLIQKVIVNLKRDPEYYMKTTLSFVVRENDLLYRKYDESGYFKQ